MGIEANQLAQFNEKKVVITKVGGEKVEGTATSANVRGILFKAKGRANLEIFMPAEIEAVELVVEAPVDLKATELKALELSGARKHLLNYHGWTLASVNALTDEAALAAHGDIDHSTLGHTHKA